MDIAQGSGPDRIYIIGAGFAGQSIAKEISGKNIYGHIIAFLDDDTGKIGQSIEGIPVLGPIDEVLAILEPKPNDQALITIPSADQSRLRNIYEHLKKAKFPKIRILPRISHILEGQAHFIETRSLNPQDLLSREPIKIGLKQSLSYLRGKRVLITGAGGSIGSELARQLLHGGASRLYLFGHGENSIFRIEQELRLLQKGGVGEKATIVPIIGELQDPDYLNFLLPRLKPNVIFHTAAHKHVNLMENNPVVAIQNNVFGTKHLIDAAKNNGCERFVLISTDKAVNPSSIYGVSKKIAEKITLSQTNGSSFKSMVVRFGNVLGSRGSIIPIFSDQILSGGPVTITDSRATRFFMTIEEAASLVLKAGGVGDHGQLYLLEMGDPINIEELAKQLINFFGFQPDEIPIQYIGLRPGEKLTESLTEDHEKAIATEFPGIQLVNNALAQSMEWVPILVKELGETIFNSQSNAYRNRRALRDLLSKYIASIESNTDEPEF